MNTPNLVEDEDPTTSVVKTPAGLGWSYKTWPKPLRRGLYWLIGLPLLGAACILAMQKFLQETNLRLKSEMARKNEAVALVQNSDLERADIVKYLPTLTELQAKSIFGSEKRLEWIEELRRIEKRWPGLRIKYDITAEKLLPSPLSKTPTANQTLPTPPVAGAQKSEMSLGFFRSEMRLSMQVLHEGDILAIEKELTQAGLGRVQIQECKLSRKSNQNQPVDRAGTGGAANTTVGGNLDVGCTLDWVSVRLYKPEEVSPQ